MKHTGRVLALAMLLVFAAAAAFAGGSREDAPRERTITLWTTEEQPARMEAQRDIARRFQDATGIAVEVVPVTENMLGERATAAFSAGDLPDLIYHPLNLTYSWADAGILDTQAATEVVERLGADTYGAGVLNLVEFEGDYAAVPVDGWAQLVVYRADLFAEKGLDPPTSYDAIRRAVTALHDPPRFYGAVAATDPSQVYMMQVFEHVAMANGVDIVDSRGKVTLNTPEMREALEFYKFLAEHSPPGNLYWQQSRELYHDNRTGLIVWSPFILHGLAGLRDGAPITGFGDDPTTDVLAGLSGFTTSFGGPSNPDGAGWANVSYLGITVDADVEAAQQFIEFSMNEAYAETLAIAAVGKHPVRMGTADDPERYVREWAGLEVGDERRMKLADIYEPDVIMDMLSGLERGSRWGYQHGYGYLTSRLYETRVIAELLREYIDGERSVEETMRLMQQETERLK
ncbi:bicyclomycin resistance protein [Alkalispirochaeta sphaeroplastigenens]|uniref:Bicyclomycin resistance protein n=1 Tax=Alkalispirochaeta sphaeroplastigenens TaxID=1187066 RepID=A0A2S4JXR2_9SPIO|nr:extracellular solute-binding protein [Alkalispirochaeta sphaeroplastigenens]POR04291.1 bicyclomycin resistance protein [Alkalispirochaeta sphaeroplastigenens]